MFKWLSMYFNLSTRCGYTTNRYLNLAENVEVEATYLPSPVAHMFAGTRIHMKEQPSDRLIDHRIRNRTINVVSTLPDGDDGGSPVALLAAFGLTTAATPVRCAVWRRCNNRMPAARSDDAIVPSLRAMECHDWPLR